ncbi:RadC family protein [Acidaminococcus intestini]|uniref:RadC family protein n=2 Tax=Acidaminococcus TaxID=904 RepID=UPI0005573903|nr:DNA repair protein RadC [Acidaminococcus intestini]
MTQHCSMHEIVREERPRERLKQKGAKALSVTELLTILIGSGTRSASALEIASLLTSREMDLDQLARVTRIEELTHVKGLGPARASVIVAALELGRRLAEKTSRQGDRIRCPGDAARMVMERLRYEVKEHVLTLLLSAKGKVLGIEEVFVGSASQATVHPREIFETALHHHASALILVHNHPSGDPTPSRPDIRLTERLAQVGGLMDIPLADHIIIGDGIYYSFKDADQL